jgi:hypothetical protein
MLLVYLDTSLKHEVILYTQVLSFKYACEMIWSQPHSKQ